MLAHASTVATATEHPCASHNEIEGTVATGGTSLSFSLVNGSRKFKLQGLYSNEPIPLSGAVKLSINVANRDRYNRYSVQVFSNNNWLQGTLLETGQALIYTGDMAPKCLAAMRAAELRAQQKQAGLWGEKQFHLAAQDANKISEFAGQLVAVTGKVVSIGDRKRRLYLNFGKKWSQDFTVSVVKRGKGAFKSGKAIQLATLKELAGSVIRVRGIIEERQGPLIRLAHEAQIEILQGP